jgi:hypothetical protein
MSAIAGRVLLIPKGAYNALTLYAMLDVVSYNGNSYVAKKSTQGNTPSADTEYWMILASGTSVASINDIGDVLITSATNGQVLKYDATLQRWINGDDAGGLLPHLVITSETGATVTVVKGGDTITATETSTGVYECDVLEFGTYTCHSLLNGDDATVTVNVDTVKVYNISNAHFSATITVTFPANSTCTCSKAGETPQTASVSPHTFTVHSTGTYTVSSTDGTLTASTTVSIVTDGQTESVTLSYVPNGSTVTPTDDIQIWLHCANIWDKAYTTLREVLADTSTLSALMASNNAVDYMVRSTTWAVSVTVPAMTSDTTPSGRVLYSGSPSGHEAWQAFDKNEAQDGTSNWEKTFSSGDYIGYTFTEPVCVSSFRLVNPYWNSTVQQRCIKNFKLQVSNDGNTWTDIESYTNEQVLEKVFAVNNSDSYTSYRLYITSNYGNSYVSVVELQFYSDSITTSATAMSYIGLNNYCANTLLADSTWCNAICNSEYFESVLNVKVPVMTSATTPEGEAFAESTLSADYPAWKAFDRTGNPWISGNGHINSWIGYAFTMEINLCMVDISLQYSSSSLPSSGTIYIQNSSGTNLATDTHSSRNYTKRIILPPSDNNKDSTFKVQYAGSNGSYTGADEIQFYGREDV